MDKNKLIGDYERYCINHADDGFQLCLSMAAWVAARVVKND